MTAPETVVVPLAHGLVALLVLRPKPNPDPPFGPDTPPPWEQEPLSVEDSSC